MSLQSKTPFFLSQHRIPAKTLANLACRVTVKSRIPSRYFAFSRIPHCISDPERIPFLTLVLVSLWQLDNTLLKSELSIRLDTRKTCVFRAIMTFYERYPGLFLPAFEMLLRKIGQNWHLNGKGPQTNMPQNLGSIKTWSANWFTLSRHTEFWKFTLQNISMTLKEPKTERGRSRGQLFRHRVRCLHLP